MSKKVIYIIEGSSGSYEDYHEWDECAYKSRIKAEYECRKLNKELSEALQVFDEGNDGWHFRFDCNDNKCSDDCDNWKYCKFDEDQHEYEIKEVRFVD